MVADGDSMLEMSGRLAIASDDGPLVRHQPYLAVAHGNHGFDGNAHASLKHDPVALFAIIGNRWILMHLTAYTMTCKLTHNTIAQRLDGVLHRPSNIAQMLSGYSLLDSIVKSLFSSFQQLPNVLVDFANAECIARIPVVTVKDGSTIDGDDITLFQEDLCGGYAMHHNAIDGSAD